MTKKVAKTVAKIVLLAVGLTGLLVMAAAVPNVVNALPSRSFKAYAKGTLDKSIRRLLKRGLLKFVQGNRGWRLELTPRGHELFEKLEMELRLSKPKKWDRKWHLLIFDIEETRKKIRDRLRRSLLNMGFYRLQDSVWVYPYPCEEILELLRTKYGVRHDALYVCAQKIAKDQWLREHFKLN